MAHPTRSLFLWLGLLILLIGLAYAWLIFSGAVSPQQVPQQTTQAQFPSDAPAPRPQDYTVQQHGFQYLVQYTDSGFHPAALTVKKGETVRFTDTSNNPLRLSLESAQLAALKHAEYYEYTFANRGTFAYSDGANKMTVTVK